LLRRRLVRAYNQSAATLNLLRGFSTGGYAGLDRIAQWNLDFMANSDEGKAYMDLVGCERTGTHARLAHLQGRC
jgi:3-deoxy-D-arabino-heptulosonate 7-phosphate (DAHP) synthase class II